MSSTPSALVEPLVTSVCRRAGIVGIAAAWLVELPQVIWNTKGGMAFVKRDIYLSYFSGGYYLELGLNYVLQAYFAEPRPNAHCVDGNGFPSFEAEISFLFVGFIVAHYLLWNEHMRYSSWLYLFVLTTLIPWALYYNGMNSLPQLAAGALIGLINGFVRVYVYKYYLQPYVPLMLREFALFRLLEFKDCYFHDLAKQRREAKSGDFSRRLDDTF